MQGDLGVGDFLALHADHLVAPTSASAGRRWVPDTRVERETWGGNGGACIPWVCVPSNVRRLFDNVMSFCYARPFFVNAITG